LTADVVFDVGVVEVFVDVVDVVVFVDVADEAFVTVLDVEVLVSLFAKHPQGPTQFFSSSNCLFPAWYSFRPGLFELH
jgi:hypothetical protein